jgi:single-strand DNA-binding protein
MIKLQCIGHLGKDAVVNQVNGKSVINFNVAHSEKYKDSNGTEINKTIWVSCGYWSDKTTIAQYLMKGTLVYVEGTPDIKTYQDSQGKTNANIILRVNNIQLLGGKKEERSGNYSPDPVAAHPSISSDISTESSDLPF